MLLICVLYIIYFSGSVALGTYAIRKMYPSKQQDFIMLLCTFSIILSSLSLALGTPGHFTVKPEDIEATNQMNKHITIFLLSVLCILLFALSLIMVLNSIIAFSMVNFVKTIICVSLTILFLMMLFYSPESYPSFLVKYYVIPIK